MKSLFNFFYQARAHRPRIESKHIRWLCLFDCWIGYFRWAALSFRGIFYWPAVFQPVSIGKLSRSIFEKGATIEVNFDESLPRLEFLENQYYWPPVSLGRPLLAPFLNPAEARSNRFRLLRNSRIQLNGRVNIGEGFYISLKDNSEFKIADRVYIGKRFYCAIKSRVSIGSNCLIGDDVRLIDYDGHQVKSLNQDDLEMNLGGQSAEISIEENCWIAWNVMITKGVTIGKGSIIASNSFVTKSVPPNSLVMGNPARVVKEGVAWQNF